MSRLRRFLHIERSRAGAPGADPGAAAARRIGGVEPAADSPAAPSRSGADLGRFAAPPPPPLELDPATAGERPFTRCPRCARDHHVSAVECEGCGARLDGEECRAFNDRLWEERRAEAAREAEADAARSAARAEAAAARRAFAEELAREVGERERRRLDAELGPGAEVTRGAWRLLEWLTRRR